MGVDSRAYFPGIDKKQIANFMKFLAPDASLESSNVAENYKILFFSYKGEKRKLNLHSRFLKKSSYIDSVMKEYNISKEEAEEWWKEDTKPGAEMDGLPLGTNGIYASLGYWGRNLEIMKILCYRFGGYLDESDSDEENYYKIDKNLRKIIELVFNEV